MIRKTVLTAAFLLLIFSAYSRTWRVNGSSTGTIQNGYNWSTALKSLRAAIDSSRAGDTIVVAQGIYVPGNSIDATFLLKSQVVFLGGYSSSDTNALRNFSINKTILSGRFSTTGIGRVRHVVTASGAGDKTVLDGFIVEEGYASGGLDLVADMTGGGMVNFHSKARISNCVFRNNHATNGGSAMSVRDNSTPVIENVFFVNNDYSAAIYCQGSIPVNFSNCIFADNKTSINTPIAYIVTSTVNFLNCTFFRNGIEDEVQENYGGILAESSNISIKNSIFFSNYVYHRYEGSEINGNNSTISVSNTITQNVRQGSQILLGANPRFKDTSNVVGPDGAYFTNDDGLQLMAPCSPGLNVGNNSDVAGLQTDITGKPRTFNGVVDLGAYELQTVPGVANKVAYVNAIATGNNDGSSWQNAFKNLQDAFSYCADTIKVASGTYFPSTNNNMMAFWLRNKLVVLGGYPNVGNPGDNLRNPVLNVTRLSGQLPNSGGIRSTNLIFANWVDSTSRIDGFFISDGAAGAYGYVLGAIRVTNTSNPIFMNCMLENNSGYNAAALRIERQSRPTFVNCELRNNITEESAGAFWITGQSSAMFSNCRFVENKIYLANIADGNGAAGVINNSNAIFDSCLFKKNVSNFNAGAIWMINQSKGTFRNCNFIGNSAQNIANDLYVANSQADYLKCLFSDSTVVYEAGSSYNTSSLVSYELCEFRNGSADRGGAILNEATTATFKKCAFYGNGGAGAGIFNRQRASVKMVNCIATENSGDVVYNANSVTEIVNSTITRNIGRAFGGEYFAVFRNADSSKLILKNSIVWGNYPPARSVDQYTDILNLGGSSRPSVTEIFNTATQVYGINGVNGNLVGISPRVVDYFDADGPDNKFFTNDDGLRLAPCSPTLNTGLNSYTTEVTDILGNPRVFNSVIDMGAYELQANQNLANTAFVSPASSGLNDGTSWGNAYKNFHYALNNVCADTIKVSAGTYYSAVTSKDSAFYIKYGKVILGGYSLANPNDSLRDPIVNQTLLSGNVGNKFDSIDNAQHVVSMYYTDGKTIIDGLIIQDGFGRRLDNSTNGGGLDNIGSDLNIRNCIFQKNFASGFGGGLSSISKIPLKVENTLFRNNKANDGGGMYFGGGGTLNKVVFTENEALNKGGGLYAAASGVVISNSILFLNTAVWGGGGAYIVNPNNFRYVNTSFIRNKTSNSNGGGIFVSQNSYYDLPEFYNCVFNENRLGGNFPAKWADAYLTQCSGDNDVCYYSIFFNSMLQTIPHSTNEVIGNPAYVDINSPAGPDGVWMTADDGLRLTHCSVLINRGANNAVTNIPNDIINRSRIIDGIVDLGPYEYSQTLAGTLLVNAANDSANANKEFTDSLGWTHYFRNCSYLFSIKKNGKNLGNISDGSLKVGVVTRSTYGTSQPINLTNANFNPSGNPLFAFNRYWFVNTSALITDSVLVRFPYATTDYNDISSANPILTDHRQLEFYKATSYPYNLSLPLDSILFYKNDSFASTNKWKYYSVENYHVSEFYVRGFSSGSGASRLNAQLSDLTITDISTSVDSLPSASSFQVKLREKNVGQGIAGFNKVAYYLSTDTLLNKSAGGDLLLSTSDVNQNLAFGQFSDTITKQLTIPCGTPAGTYYLFFAADYVNTVPEISESNNNFFKKLTILQGPIIPTGISISSSRTSDTLCAGDSAILTAIITPQCNNCTYQWVGGFTTQSITVKTSGVYLVNAGNICGVLSRSKTIIVRPEVPIFPKASPDKICLGDSTLLFDALGNGVGSVVWNGPGLPATTAFQLYVKPPVAGNVQYTATGYSQDGKCSTTKNVSVAVSSSASPILQISYNGCVNPIIFKVASIANGGTAPIYKWYKNDTLVKTGDTSLTLNDVAKGTRIYATVKSQTNCAKPDTARSNTITYDCITTGIDEIPGVSAFSISPNPSSGEFLIRMHLNTVKKVRLSLTSGSGSKVLELGESVWSGNITKRINLQNQPVGIYYLQFLIDSKLFTYKLVVVR